MGRKHEKKPSALPALDEITPTNTASSKKRVIICANTLPVIFERNQETGKWSCRFDLNDSLFEDGPMFAALKELENTEVLYVGVPNAYIPDRDQQEVEMMLGEMNCYPVFCAPKRAHNHFQGYCKGVLWPTFHNVIDLYSSSGNLEPESPTISKDGVEDQEQWERPRSWSPVDAEICWPDHCAMNRLFSLKVIEVFSPGDIIWIHNYHLLLLANYLSRKLVAANPIIGLFIHIPFPSSEVFRILAAREEILRAMLCANHIGFHMFAYARHFLTCCSRMLGLSYEARSGGVINIDNNGTNVIVTCSHVGLNTDYVLGQLASTECRFLRNKVDEQQLTANGQQLMISIDEVEGLRGISLKLHAFTRLLKDYPTLRNKVVLYQIGLKLNCRPNDYNQCHKEVVRLVNSINNTYGHHVHYVERSSIGLPERLALFAHADVFVETSVRLGMNMLPLEYLLASKERHGTLLISEFSAASRLFPGALLVNPYKTNKIAAAMEELLTMPAPERQARAARDRQFVLRSTLLKWAERILGDISLANQTRSQNLAKFGFGFATRHKGLKNGVVAQVELDETQFCDGFRKAQRRLLVFDYSGTLVETSSIGTFIKSGGDARAWHYENGGSERPSGCLETRDQISDAARSYLIDLCRNPQNTVVVVSGDLREELAHALTGIPNLALIAENGFVFRMNPNDTWKSAVDQESGGDWYAGGTQDLFLPNEGVSESASTEGDTSEGASIFDTDVDQKAMDEWHVQVLSLMEQYCDRTNGSFVWSSPSAVSFNYYLADPDLGKMQSSTLARELENMLALLPLSVDTGKGYVTVRLRGVNRSTALRELLMHQARTLNLKYDFIAAFGDDVEDEGTFGTVNKYRFANTQSKYSVRVGSGHATKAKYFVNDTDDVTQILKSMAESAGSGKIRKSFSKGDFGGRNDQDRVGGVLITKQSLLSLSQLNDEQKAELTSPKSIERPITHTPSYVASKNDAAELWGEGYGSMLPPPTSPAPVTPPESIKFVNGDHDQRPIPRSTSAGMEDDSSSVDSSESEDFNSNMNSRYGNKSNSLYRFDAKALDDDDVDDTGVDRRDSGYKGAEVKDMAVAAATGAFVAFVLMRVFR